MSLFEAKGLVKIYNKDIVLDHVSLSLSPNEILGIIGPNGSGKTTLLSIIMGLIASDEGTIHKKENLKMGGLIEEPTFYEHLSAAQNLNLIAYMRDVEKPVVDGLLEMVGLLSFKHKKFIDFSLGMKQRLAIAAVLIGSPDLIILDEPTNGLDPLGILDLRMIIQEIKSKGIAVILTSHMLSEIDQLCDNILVLKYGHPVFFGSKNQFIQNSDFSNLEDAFISILKTSN